MAVSIHRTHRKMAEIVQNCLVIDCKGKQHYLMGACELQLLMPLLLRNLELVRKTDNLKEMAYQAQLAGDMDWVMDLTAELEEIEAILS